MPTTTLSPTIRVEKTGGPEEMRLVDLPVGEPGANEVRIRHHAIGLNFIDVYQRSGIYPLPLPLSLGNEGAGVIEAVGPGVAHLKAGDRAVYCGGPPGSYSLARVMPARHAVRLPDAISFEIQPTTANAPFELWVDDVEFVVDPSKPSPFKAK